MVEKTFYYTVFDLFEEIRFTNIWNVK